MKKNFFIPSAVLLFIAAILFSNCKKISFKESTTSDVNILEYLQQDSLNRFSELVSIINKTGYDAALNVYGTYTLFAPTNDAIDAYLKTSGKGSIDNMSVQDLKDMLKFHLLEEVVRTSDFNDGKLPSVTMLGQFLVTGVKNIDGISSFTVNRQAIITQPNIVLGNGIIQVVDHVLIPTNNTLAKQVESNPDYSIFTQALKATGFYDMLDSTVNPDKSHRWLTLIAQTDSIYKTVGIRSYADLKAKYSHTGDPKRADDSLHLYMAYHILYEAKYLADIVMSSSHQTLAPLEVITDKMTDDKRVLVNDDEYSTLDSVVHERGFELEQANSDVTATNGVLHRSLGNLAIKVRSPFPVYWDLCATQPELTRLSSIYRKKTYLFDYGDGNTLKDVKWEKSCLKYRAGVQGYLGDYWQMGLGTSSSNTDNLGSCSSNSWIEFTTPLLVKGRYKVWFTYYTQNTSKIVNVQGSFDSIPLTSALIQFHQKISSIDPAQEVALEAIGWKWWAGAAKKSGSTAARMLGIVDVKVTGRHKIRFDLVSGSNSDCNLDMVHFIPINMNQTSPHFNPDGTIED